MEIIQIDEILSIIINTTTKSNFSILTKRTQTRFRILIPSQMTTPKDIPAITLEMEIGVSEEIPFHTIPHVSTEMAEAVISVPEVRILVHVTTVEDTILQIREVVSMIIQTKIITDMVKTQK